MPETPFVLARAIESDINEISELEYDCFPEWVRKMFMGCYSREDLKKVKQRHIKQMQDDPNDVWVKVTDKKSGRVVAASNWKLYINGQSHGGTKEEPPEDLEGEDAKKSKEIFDKMNASKADRMPGPFIHLHICFTDSNYRRRGAGGLMLKWGCDLMDLLQLPGWIEASDEGNFLYKAYGFYDFEKIEGELGGTNMKRDPRPSAFEGGK